MRYIEVALKHAKYELIEDEEPYYGEIPMLQGVWATGNTLEECRENLIDALEGWLLVRIRQGKEIPQIDKVTIALPEEII